MVSSVAVDQEPIIARPGLTSTPVAAMPSTGSPLAIPAKRPGERAGRYVPERGMVRRLRTDQANGAVRALAERHHLDPETRDVLGGELIKAGAPPITAKALETGLARLVRFEPLNADALRPFLVLAADRDVRAWAVGRIADAMRSAGRSVRILSDAVDAQTNKMLSDAGARMGCGIVSYDGSPNCVEILKKTDLACLSLIEAGFRAPLDRVALLRLGTLVAATGSEPVCVLRPEDAALAVDLAGIGVKRVILAVNGKAARLGPVLSALRESDLALADIIDLSSVTAPLRAATAGELSAMLLG